MVTIQFEAGQTWACLLFKEISTQFLRLYLNALTDKDSLKAFATRFHGCGPLTLALSALMSSLVLETVIHTWVMCLCVALVNTPTLIRCVADCSPQNVHVYYILCICVCECMGTFSCHSYRKCRKYKNRNIYIFKWNESSWCVITLFHKHVLQNTAWLCFQSIPYFS